MIAYKLSKIRGKLVFFVCFSSSLACAKPLGPLYKRDLMTPSSAKMESSPGSSHPSPTLLALAHPGASKISHLIESPESRSRSHSRSSSRVSSFGFVKEDVEGIAQSFLDTATTTRAKEGSEDNTSVVDMMAAVDQMPDFCCPCGGFMGWKQIRLRGRKMSKSYSDLSLLGQRSSSMGWMWDTASTRPTIKQVYMEVEETQPGLTIEDLPIEVLGKS